MWSPIVACACRATHDRSSQRVDVMYLQLDEEQTLIRQSAREFLAQAFPSERARAARLDPRGIDDALWRQMADLGWMGLVVPERYGGAGASFLDLAVLLEEIGYACLTGPFFSTAVTGALSLLYAADEPQRQLLLPLLARGGLKLALALDTQRAGFDPSTVSVLAKDSAGAQRLYGAALFVADAAAADILLCPAIREVDGALTLYRVAPGASGVTLSAMPTIGGAHHYAVELTNVEATAADTLGQSTETAGGLQRAISEAAVAKCAEMVGGAQRVLDTAVAYAREREQFGRPIGSFQAIQHHCVNMLMDLECARWISYKAAAAIDRGALEPSLVAKAKVCCNEAYRRIVRLGHQVMGGIGYCEEHEMPLYFRHVRMAETAFGDVDDHLEVLAAQLLDGKSPAITEHAVKGAAS